MKVTRHTTIQSKKVAVPESYRKARSSIFVRLGLLLRSVWAFPSRVIEHFVNRN